MPTQIYSHFRRRAGTKSSPDRFHANVCSEDALTPLWCESCHHIIIALSTLTYQIINLHSHTVHLDEDHSTWAAGPLAPGEIYSVCQFGLCGVQDLSCGALVVGSRSEVLSTHFSGAVRFTPAVSALKWAYQPMVVTAAPVSAAPEAVRL